MIKTEEFNEFLTKGNIKWKFNLPRAPWWGGNLKRLIGLTKQLLFKSLGKTSLSWNELESVLLDVEVNLKNGPLTYIEDNIQNPIFTENSMLLGQDTVMLEEDTKEDDRNSCKKHQKYIVRCKDAAWRRWKREYLTVLHESHNMAHKTKVLKIDIGDVIMIKGEDKKRGKWKISIVKELYRGKDQEILGVQIETAKGCLERPIQLLYPLELPCNEITSGDAVPRTEEVPSIGDIQSKPDKLNVNVSEFQPKRRTAINMNDMVANEIDDE